MHLPDNRYKDSDARQLLRSAFAAASRDCRSDARGNCFGCARTGRGGEQIELEHAPIANPAQRPWVSFVAQSPGYLETIHLPLLEGRDFNETDGTANHEAAILTRDAATRLWPGQNPMGKRFRFFDDKNKATAWITVIGISANMVQELQENDPKPLLFVPYRQEGWDNMAVVVESTADPLQAMRMTVQSLDGELPLR